MPFFNSEYLKNVKSVAFKISELRFLNAIEANFINDNHNFDSSTMNVFFIEVDIYIGEKSVILTTHVCQLVVYDSKHNEYETYLMD